ncbi:MAG TPA: alpha/beta-hydrolase family protein [Actinomycetospora sp.]|nr:alpha/beta-hydrolase family protein [Actinomycetospora sp.]
MADGEGRTVSRGATPVPVAPREESDTEFQAVFEDDLEHHHLWHREGQRHQFGGDSPLLPPRLAPWVRYVPRAHPAGVVLGTAFGLISLTPSLIPRDYLFQGLATGISGALGYALGVAIAWLLARTARWTDLTDRIRRAQPVWVTPGAWVVLVLTATAALLGILLAGAEWQRQVAGLMGLEQPTTDGWLRAGPVALVVAGVLVGLGRGVRWLAGRVADLLRRRVHLPRRVAAIVGTVLTLFLVVVVVDTLVVRTGLRVADSVFGAANDQPFPGVVAPASPLRSGSPASRVPWATIGREGQTFVSGGRAPGELATASGRPPLEPIRVYAGLLSAPGPAARAALAVADLERTGAFDRAVLAVVTTTGTGWIDAPTTDALELVWGGDTAIVATQYSYLPSWLSFVVDRTRAEAEGRALFDAVHARVERMPPDRQPRLLVFGESLGSYGSEAAFSSLEDARTQADGVLWVGPPNSNRLHEALTARRDPGSRAILPVVDAGREVRFGATAGDLARPPGPWYPPRVVYLQHASDPVVWWSPTLLWSRPAWLAEPRGPDVSPTMDWFPVVTFWQVTIDLTNSLSVPDGHGHVYRSAVLDGWLALGTPPGWTDADTTRVAGILEE